MCIGNSSAYAQGYDACYTGEDNPYEIGSEDYIERETGLHDAFEDDVN